MGFSGFVGFVWIRGVWGLGFGAWRSELIESVRLKAKGLCKHLI